MGIEIQVANQSTDPVTSSLADLYEMAIRLSNALSSHTEQTYTQSRTIFFKWCQSHGANPLKTQSPEALISFFVTDLTMSGHYKSSSICTYVAGICKWYQENGYYDIKMSHPIIKKTIYGMYRTIGRQVVQKSPVTTEMLLEMIRSLPTHDSMGYERTVYYRDKSLLLMGFVGAFRRSEVVSLLYEDLEAHRDGYLVHLRRSKTDQHGNGMTKIVPYGSNPETCPVRALNDWLEIAKISSGYIYPAFRGCKIRRDVHVREENYVSLIKKHVKNPDRYAGHSMRAGFVTSAAQREVPEHLIMQQTGHRSLDRMRGYIRLGQSFSKSAASRVGL